MPSRPENTQPNKQLLNLLAIETASNACSLALYANSKINYLEENTPHSHTRFILPMIDRLLEQQSLKISELDAIAYDAGPGSFTGLRIGAAVTQGLAYAHDLPVIRVSSLAAMALKAKPGYAAVCLDARMDEVYFAKFKLGENLVQIGKAQLVKPRRLRLDEDKDWQLIGNGWAEYSSRFKPTYLDINSHNFEVMPHAKEIAKLALWEYSEKLVPEAALPIYLKSAVN